jgi:hypothetical protein
LKGVRTIKADSKGGSKLAGLTAHRKVSKSSKNLKGFCKEVFRFEFKRKARMGILEI